MELFDLYDVNRHPLGITMERGGFQPEGAYRLVVHICIFLSDGKMLCQRRVASKRVYPSLWDLSCGGCVDAGETSVEGAIRETKEELGITLPADIVPSLTVHFNYGFDDVYCVTMDVDVSDVVLQAEEVAEVMYLTKEQIHSMIDAKKFIPYSHEYIDYLFYCQNHRGLATRDLESCKPKSAHYAVKTLQCSNLTLLTDKEKPLKGDVK